MRTALIATPSAATQISLRHQAARPQTVTVSLSKHCRGGSMRKMRSYGAATKQALLGNFSLGSRSFNTVQASQPITTAEVLQQWQQEVYTRQTQHARQQPAAELPFPRKHLNRSRRSQRLNIVPTSDKTANSNQQASQFMHEGSNQQSASSGMPSTHRSQSAYRTAAEKRPQPKSAPKGTNLRSLATSSMLMSHAQLLQQLQQAVQPSSISASKAEGMQVTSTNSVNGLPTSLLNRSAGPETTNSLQSTPAMRHGHVNVTHQQAAAYKGPENQNSDAELDTISLTLDLVDNQLPSWSNKQPLDWSAQQDISCYQPQLRVASNVQHSKHILTKFSMSSHGEQLDIQPLWIAVHQEQPGGPARLYETVHSLQPEVLQHIPEAVEPFCLAEGMTFGKPQISHGPWKGYLVGVVGNVAAEEDDVLWPNRLFCGKRVMHNVRNGWDIAKFLAEPTLQDMQGHHTNLKLLQEDRNYQPGWIWHMLRSRWGDEAVTTFSSAQAAEQVAAHQQALARQQVTASQRHAAHQGALQQARLRMAAQQRAGHRLVQQHVVADRALQFA